MARPERSRRRRVLLTLEATLVVVLTIYAPGSPSSGASNRHTAAMMATEAVQRAVVAAQAGDQIPKVTTPRLRKAHGDYVDLGDCSAFRKLRSKICPYGDAKGTKTVVVFGNSHSVMWVPGISLVAKAEKWRVIPLVKEACGYEGYVGNGDNPCVLFYKWAKDVIARLHPDVIVIGSYTSPSNWQIGEETVVAQLKRLTRRLILLTDTPWIPRPATCLSRLGATLKSCLWDETPARVQAAVAVRKIAASMRVQYVDVTPWFCDDGLCPSVIDDYIPYYDGSHLTPQYSAFLANDLGAALDLNGTSTVPPVEVRVISDH